MDRIFAGVFVGFLTWLTYLGVFSENYTWWKILAPTSLLWCWAYSGKNKIPVGWKAQLLFIGGRLDFVLEEGWRWVPFPFSLRAVDCRQQTVKLDPLEVVSSNNVSINIEGAIVYKIKNISLYLNINEADVKLGLDDLWDEIIRGTVRRESFDDILGMQIKLGRIAKEAIADYTSLNWGIEILKIVIAGIKMSPKMKEDMELREREQKQRNGQELELDFFKEAVKKLIAKPPDGPGLTEDQAVLQVRVAMGQQRPPTLTTQNYGLDPGTATILATVLGSILGGKKP